MSNYQQGFDRMRDKDRVSPREEAEEAKEVRDQHKAQVEGQPQGEDWVPPGNSGQGSRKE